MLTVGTYLADRYEIVSKIGAGGMSDVYKAKDHVLGRFVAIKVLKPEFSEDRGFVAKFRTEAQSAAGLEHPNIVNIYDVGSEEGLHYIVMEYVEGITLKTYIEKKGQLSFKEAVSIAIQVARGIEAAHNKQIIHRDIKPQNLMISTEGKVKVMDFGIARAASSNTVSSDVMGSVHYSSPEQARNGFVDGRSDIYSLGIVMYEMVTGRVPFDGDTTVAVAIQHLQEEMTPPSVYAKNLPISMEKIILKCTQKNADRRYQTIGDLLADLRRSLVHPDEDFALRCRKIMDYESKLYTLISHLKQEFDFCLIDCPAGIEDGFHFAVSAADRAVVVTSPHISAVRDAGRVICLLDGMRLSQIDLLINAYNARMVRKHDMLSQKDVEDILGLSAIGVIPADERIVVSQNKGIPVLSMHTKATRAFMTAARAFANPRVIPVDLNKEDPCIRQGKIYLGGKECEYEG